MATEVQYFPDAVPCQLDRVQEPCMRDLVHMMRNVHEAAKVE